MLAVYELKVGLCLVAFYLVWKLLLSRETLHRFNRVVLLSMTLLALVLPLIRISVSEAMQAGTGTVALADLIAVGEVTSAPAPDWKIRLFAYSLYIIYIGGFAVFCWLLYADHRARRPMQERESYTDADGDRIHLVHGDEPPYSYFGHIVINEQDYRENGSVILTHEKAHIRLGHSYDLMLMALLLLLQWWNPAAWLLRRELKQIHEYEADEAVLERGVNARQYQLLLIRKSVGDQLFSMANNLNYQSLKKRIRMMTTKKSSRWQQLRALAIVPVAGLALVAFAQPEVENMTAQIAEQAALPMLAAEKPVSSEHPDLLLTALEQTAPRDTSDVFDVVEQMPEYPGGMEALMRYLSMNLRYPVDAQKEKKEGRVIVSFIVESNGSVSEAKIVRGVFPSLDAEALRVVNGMEKWIPGRQKGKAVRVKFTLPINFNLQGKEKTNPVIVVDNGTPAEEEPIIFVDGKEVTKAEVEALDQGRIESVDVLKKESAMKTYGEKGKNGAILIRLKK